MFESLKKEIVKELSSKIIEKKPNSDDELMELVEDVIKEKIKK